MINDKLKKITVIIALIFCFAFTFMNVKAQTVKVYPSTLRIEKGKSKTLTAVAFDGSGNYIYNQTFAFTSNNTSIATVSKSREGNVYTPSYVSKNLADVQTAATAGTTTVYATLNGINSSPVTVLVDDPNAAPTAVVHGDNDASGGNTITTKVGEPIEINAESSLGVKTIEWNWGDGDKTTDLFSSTHTYLTAGTYTFQLTVKNSAGTTATKTITVTVQNQTACTAANTTTVTSVAALQTAYNALTSAGGKCLLLAPGVYNGNLVLAPKNFTDYVTIGTNASLPNIKDRITNNSSSLVTIRSATRTVAPLTISNGTSATNKAGKLRFIGIKFDPKNEDWTTDIDIYYIVNVGNFTQTAAYQNPEKVIFQHCVLNPPNNIEVAHGLLNNGYKVSIISSWFGNIKTRDAGDSQAIFGLSGRGAHSYVNNYLEAGSETILYGGTGCNTNGCAIDGVVPTNIELRRNFLTKRLSWRTDYNYGEVSVKNLFETKTGRRIYAEGNVFKNHWDDYENQAHALVFKSAVGNGSGGYLWNVTEDVVFENNRISHIQGGIGTARDTDSDQYPAGSYDPLKISNLRFKNNVFDDTTAERFGAPGGRVWFFSPVGVDDVIIDHITVVDPRDNIAANGERGIEIDTINSYRPKVTNSIIPLNQYGINSSCGGGITALNVSTGGGVTNPCVPELTASWTINNNVMPKIGTVTTNYPANNFYPDFYSGVGLVNYVLCNSDTEACDQPVTNFALSMSSAYKNAGSDGLDVGANIPFLAQRIACSETGLWANCTSQPVPTPYPGPNPPNIPATVEAENFDKGGEAVAYHEVSGYTESGVYRTNPIEAVDLQARSTASNGYAVMEAAAGEWLGYTINAPSAGYYNIGVTYSSEYNGGKFHVEIDGVNVSGAMTVVSTGYWGTFQTLTKNSVSISAGTHFVKLVLDSNATDGCACVVANFDKLTFQTGNAGQAIVFNGTNQYAQITLPNTSEFNNLSGFQIVWRVRPVTTGNNLEVLHTISGMETAQLLPSGASNPPRMDLDVPRSTSSLYNTPADFSDTVCKLQLNPANSQGTFEMWKSDGTGYVLKTFNLDNNLPYNLAGQTLTIGANYYGFFPTAGKLDYWRWIKRVEATGVFPTAAAPTGVNYLLDYEFDGNANDLSGKNANLTLFGSPTYTVTP